MAVQEEMIIKLMAPGLMELYLLLITHPPLFWGVVQYILGFGILEQMNIL